MPCAPVSAPPTRSSSAASSLGGRTAVRLSSRSGGSSSPTTEIACPQNAATVQQNDGIVASPTGSGHTPGVPSRPRPTAQSRVLELPRLVHGLPAPPPDRSIRSSTPPPAASPATACGARRCRTSPRSCESTARPCTGRSATPSRWSGCTPPASCTGCSASASPGGATADPERSWSCWPRRQLGPRSPGRRQGPGRRARTLGVLLDDVPGATGGSPAPSRRSSRRRWRRSPGAARPGHRRRVARRIGITAIVAPPPGDLSPFLAELIVPALEPEGGSMTATIEAVEDPTPTSRSSPGPVGDATRLRRSRSALARNGVVTLARRGGASCSGPATKRRERRGRTAAQLRGARADVREARSAHRVEPGLFPDVLSAEIRRLLDAVPPEPARRVRRVIERELGDAHRGALFRSFDEGRWRRRRSRRCTAPCSTTGPRCGQGRGRAARPHRAGPAAHAPPCRWHQSGR